MQKNVAIFASGAGSNAQKIIEHFKNSEKIKVALVVSNKKDAGVLHIAEANAIETLIISKKKLDKGVVYLQELKSKKIDFIVLAGFLCKIPADLIHAYPQRILNIHPALLPKYGGKGMYGHHVHEAVIAGKELESGITIHYVDELYDHGAIIFQATVSVAAEDTPQTLAKKIHLLEHKHFPQVIERVISTTI